MATVVAVRYGDRVNPLVGRIQWILDARKISQRELAKRSGLQGPHVGLILARLRKNPKASIEHETLLALAKGGEVSPGWLLTGDGEPEKGATYSPEPPSTVLERDPVEPGLWRRLRDIIGWDEAVEEAKRLFGDQLPDAAFDLAGEIRAKDWPLRADPAMAAQWAKTAMWQKDRDERMRKEMASVAADLAAYRKAQGEQ